MAPSRGEAPNAGRLIINADDWGRDPDTTSRIFECALHGTVSSVSAMVFMRDSERAGAMARDSRIDAGLHLNLSEPFSSPSCPRKLAERQHELVRYLARHRLARVLFSVSLARYFEYVVEAQLDEYRRIYGTGPKRIDGHHHMHLCANVLFGRLLPRGTMVRRTFTFEPGEIRLDKRLYCRAVDHMLARRHRLADFFFSLQPLHQLRLQRIISLARRFVVEVETHPANAEEYHFLTGPKLFQWAADVPITASYALSRAGYSERTV